jgi:sodium/bile acid cotransporter 7
MAVSRAWTRFLPDGFVIAMLCAVAVAFAVPWLGAPGSPVPFGAITQVGIALVFFLHGANLSREVLIKGVTHWRLHLFVQASTFILFPLIGFAILIGGRMTAIPNDLLIGFFYLCALPSTVSSSVAMTALGRGNVPAAVFNASLSGLIGMVVTPLLVGLIAGDAAGEMPSVGRAIGDVALTLLLPFALGQASRPLTGAFLARHKKWIGKIDRGVILLIVFTAFAASTAAGTWATFGLGLLALTIAMTGAILAVALTITMMLARLAGFARADEVTAVFCGSKKSLASGAPMARILFASHPSLGMIMLPLMLYHQLQLIVCSILARRYAQAADAQPEAMQVAPAR